MAKYPYNTRRWQHLRLAKLMHDPNCWYCEKAGRVTAANTVDHIIPHRGHEYLMWDWNNLRSGCTSCHNSVAQIKDNHGYAPGVDQDGIPLDDQHPWMKGEGGSNP